ncbi:MAG: DUF3108 domain-containing protein [Opitutus sp.]|nr:DUF3108 domain-containing protein [Opitutus sp.]
MIMRLCLLLSWMGIVLPGFAAAPTPPMHDGERLTYRVSWAIVAGAGEIKLAARQITSAEGTRLVVTQSTTTRRLAKMLLPFEAEAASTFDVKTGRLLTLHEKSSTRSKKAEHTVSFNYDSRIATYLSAKAPNEPRPLPIPAGDPTDLMMGLLQTRTWDLKPGEKRDALVLFDDDFYELTIHMLRYEDVRTPLGMFRTIVLEPRMDKTAPQGMFKRGSTVRIWIAQDRHRLPVKFEVEFKIGTGTATIESYEPSPSAPPKP